MNPNVDKYKRIPFLRILLVRVGEEARDDCLAYLCKVAAARGDLELVPVHDGHQLLAHVLRLAQRANLSEMDGQLESWMDTY
jgi:hypothetical protein